MTKISDVPDGKTVGVGDVINYTITIENDGNLTIKEITLTDTVEGHEPADITANLDKTELKPGETATASYSYTVVEADLLAGHVKNTAVVGGKDPEGKDPDPEPGTTDDPTDPIDTTLDVEKKITNLPADGKAFKLGETIEYTITVTNKGNVTFHNVNVNDEATGLSETIETLAVGETKTFTTEHVVTEADIIAGYFTNTVTGKGDPIPDPLDPENPKTPEDEDTVTTGDEDDPDNPPEIEPKDPHLTVVKVTTSEPENGETYGLGEWITYLITVTNDGNLTISDITVIDLLEGFIFDELDAVTNITLTPGGSWEYTGSYEVTEADQAAGVVVNEATATGKDPEGKDPEVTPGITEDPTTEPWIWYEEELPAEEIMPYGLGTLNINLGEAIE